MSSPADQRVVEGQIAIAIERLSERYSYRAHVLERFQVRHSPDIATLGVTVEGDAIVLLCNAEFLQSVSFPELEGLLLQQVHHILFNHVLADPADFPDCWARTVAEELTVNEFITEPLPKGAIRLDKFPQLPPGETTHDRYRRLAKLKRRFPISIDFGHTEKVCGTAGQAEAAASAGQSAACRSQAKCTKVLDDHRIWASARHDTARSAEVIKMVLEDAAVSSDFDALPEWLQKALSSSGISTDARAAEERVERDGQPTLDWVRLLRRYVGRALQVHLDFRRPSRRFPELVGIVPCRRRQAIRPKIFAVIDTSGSITADLLQVINGELARMAKTFVVVVVECDDQIQKINPYHPLRSVHGRGGTDLRPPFEANVLRKHRPDLIIYFTDGEGPAPKRPPAMPVIWVLTPGGERPAKWGRALTMGHGDGK